MRLTRLYLRISYPIFKGLKMSKLSASASVLLLATTCIGTSLKAESLDTNYSGSVRVRYETLNNPIFPTDENIRAKTNQRLSTRIRLKGEANYGNWNAVAEIEDSRAYLDENDPTLKSSQVNTLEPVQLYITYKGISEVIDSVTIGRVTLDHGSRRLIGRTRFRNATNSFEGALINASWSGWHVRGFYLLPLTRFPLDSASIDSNKRAFDKSYSNQKFYGVYAESEDNTWKVHSYWLKESDSEELATKNRDLFTLSVDYSKTFSGDWKYNIEAIGQTGRARQSTSTSDIDDKDVTSWMIHSHIGRQISASTFIRAEIDAASGDNDSTDNTIKAFDSLYGLRRFDFGPTDVYQTFPRSNILAPGLRGVTKLNVDNTLMLGYKGLWLQKVAEGEEDFLGHQIEFRLRYQASASLRLELGGAYLAKGDALEIGAYPDDSMYAYTGVMYSF